MPKTSDTVSIEIEKITPKQAREWLESNEVNRSLRRKIVDAYRRDMEEGRWTFTAEPIQFSRTGRLLNGQHRLTALGGAKGIRQLEMVVARGLPDETQAMMDQGVARRLSDALLLRHGGRLRNVTLVSSVTRWLFLCPEITPDMTHNSLRGKVTTAEAITTFEANPDIQHAAERAAAYRHSIFGSPTAIAYTFLHMNRINDTACQEFFEGMADMDWAWKDDPRKAALRRLQILFRDPDIKTGLETGVMVISVLSRAWNAWRKEEPMDTINVRARGGIIPPARLIP